MEINTFDKVPLSSTTEQHTLLRAAKERVENLEHALSLVNPIKINKSDITKTAMGLGGLTVCLTAIGTLISLLVKLGQSEEVEESESDEPMADQTEAIQAEQQNIETQQQAMKELADQEQDLLNKEATLAENGDHPEKLKDIQSELKAAHHNLETLHQDMKDLKLQQGQYEEHQEAILISTKVKSIQNNPIKTETALLSSLGVGTLSIIGAGAGLFAVNNSKILPKFKLHRAHKQAVQSISETVELEKKIMPLAKTREAKLPH